jgi:ABC-type antimicrobial peptide transport system permease subunit
MRRAVALTALGLLIGLAATLGFTRFMSSLLYQVRPTDPVTLVAVAALLTTTALAAAYLPARRATRVDPMIALRHE